MLQNLFTNKVLPYERVMQEIAEVRAGRLSWGGVAQSQLTLFLHDYL